MGRGFTACWRSSAEKGEAEGGGRGKRKDEAVRKNKQFNSQHSRRERVTRAGIIDLAAVER